MKLVMFDMDGTLTDAFAIEENCYVLAIEQALGLSNVVIAWETYPHTSSSYCLDAIVTATRGHPPTLAESHAVQRRMNDLMERASIVVFATHSLTVLPSFCERTILLKRGQIVADGPTADVVRQYIDGVANTMAMA